MGFLKKAKSVSEKMAAIDERIIELDKKKTSKAKDIDEKKLSIAKILGELALADSPQNEESLKLARKSLDRLTENFNDLNEQLTLLQGQRKQLGKDLSEARLRDIPPLMQEAVEGFNKILEEGLNQMKILSDTHTKLSEQFKKFTDLDAERQSAMKSLGVQEPYIGEGIVYQLPQLEHFFVSLLAYDKKVKDAIAFRKANPDYEKNLVETRARDSKPFEMSWDRKF